MSPFEELGAHLAHRWLGCQKPFGPELIDTGERYNGYPVFMLEARLLQDAVHVKVYRYTPINSEHSVLAFVPE